MPHPTVKDPSPESLPKRAKPDHEAMYHRLRENICLLDLPPGAILSENQLAAEFGASRTPVRRVLHRLEMDGLVRSKHGVGTIVTPINLPDLRQIYALRLLLTDFVADLPAIHVRDEHIRTISHMRDQYAVLKAGPPNVRDLARLYISYEDELSKAIGSVPLGEIVDRLFIQTMRIWVQLLPELPWEAEAQALIDELSDVIDVLSQRNMALLAERRRFYMQGYLGRLGDYLKSSGGQTQYPAGG